MSDAPSKSPDNSPDRTSLDPVSEDTRRMQGVLRAAETGATKASRFGSDPAHEPLSPGQLGHLTVTAPHVAVYAPLAPATICIAFGTRPRRIFVVAAGNTVNFGRKRTHHTDDMQNHVVLRRLPCRSQELDPENWKASMLISTTHWAFHHGEDTLTINDLSRNGTLVDDTPMPPGEGMELPADFTVAPAGTPIKLAGRCIREPVGIWSFDSNVILPLAQAGSPDAAVFGPAHAISLKRLGNLEEDAYVLLYRSATIGSSPSCPVHIDLPSVGPVHARFLRHRGALLVCTEPDGEHCTAVDGYELDADEAVFVHPDATLTLGDVELKLSAVSAGRMALLPTDSE